jgi:hypothetical protein
MMLGAACQKHQGEGPTGSEAHSLRQPEQADTNPADASRPG